MKAKNIFLSLCCLILFLSCQKEDIAGSGINQEDFQLKRILSYASKDSKEPVNIVSEYEYNELGEIKKVTSPIYENGAIVGVIKYDLYEYNPIGQLLNIRHYNANSDFPTGFINMKNYSYSYSGDGRREKEYIEYPQINSSEYLLYKYSDDKLVKIEKYGRAGELESYVVNEYDNIGNLVKEVSYSNDDQPFSYTVNSYSNGLLVKSDIYAGKNLEQVREIVKTYDKNNNLVMLESKELSLFSSMMSHVWRYEYQ